MKKIFVCIFVFFAININAELFTVDDLEILLPLPESPSIVGYCGQLKEGILAYLNNTYPDPVFFFGADAKLNGIDPAGCFVAAQLGFSLEIGPCIFTIPFLGGANLIFGEQTEGIYLEKDVQEEMEKYVAPQGAFLSGGLLCTFRYGNVGAMYDRFFTDKGKFSRINIYARNTTSEISYIGEIINILDGYFSIEQSIENVINDTGFDDFKSAYRINMLFREIPIKKIAINFAVFSQKDRYDLYSKYNMQGAKVYFSFGKKETPITLFSDIAYRRFFDVLMPLEYSEYKDGIYLRPGILFCTRDSDGDSYYLKLYAESGKGPLFSGVKIGLLFGVKWDYFLSYKAAAEYQPFNLSAFPANFATSLRVGESY